MDFCVKKNNSSVCDEMDLENAQVVEVGRRYPLSRYRYNQLRMYVPVDSVGRTVPVFLSSTPVLCLTNEGLRAFNIFSYHDRIEYDIPDQVKKFLQYFQVILPNYWCCFYEPERPFMHPTDCCWFLVIVWLNCTAMGEGVGASTYVSVGIPGNVQYHVWGWCGGGGVGSAVRKFYEFVQAVKKDPASGLINLYVPVRTNRVIKHSLKCCEPASFCLWIETFIDPSGYSIAKEKTLYLFGLIIKIIQTFAVKWESLSYNKSWFLLPRILTYRCRL